MNKQFYIPLIILLAISANLSAAENPDSLKKKASKLFHEERYVESIDTLNKAIEIFSERRDEYGLSCCYNNLGLYLWKLGDTSSAMKYFIKARNYAQNVSLEMVSFVNTNIGHCYFDISDFTRALYYYKIVYINNKDLSNQYYYFSLTNMSNCLIQLHDYNKALLYVNEAFEHYKKNNDQNNKIICMNYLAHIYIELNVNEDSLKSLIFDSSIKDDYFTKKYLAEYYAKKGFYEKSSTLLLELAYIDADITYKKDIYMDLVKNYLKLKQYRKSLDIINKIMPQIYKYDYLSQKDFQKNLSYIYLELNDPKNYNLTKNRIDSLNEKIIEQQKITNINLSQALLISKYQIKNLEKNCDLIEQKSKLAKLITIAAIGFVVVLSILLILVSMRRKLIKVRMSGRTVFQAAETK